VPGSYKRKVVAEAVAVVATAIAEVVVVVVVAASVAGNRNAIKGRASQKDARLFYGSAVAGKDLLQAF